MRYQGLLTVSSAQVAGQLFGALFAMAWWPWIFWRQAIALASLAVFAAWTIPPCPVQTDQIRADQDRSIRKRLEALDIPGMLTGVATLVLFNFAWNQAVVVGWQQPYVYICLILSVPLAVLFLASKFSGQNHRSCRLPHSILISPSSLGAQQQGGGLLVFGYVPTSDSGQVPNTMTRLALLPHTSCAQHWGAVSGSSRGVVHSCHSHRIVLCAGCWQASG